MANPKKRLSANVAGDFFVDSTCINCDTCRQLAPAVFAEVGEYSCVRSQPLVPEQVREATRALLACPTGSIGTAGTNLSRDVIADFPMQLAGEVYYCGFNSPKSYGGNSYFVRHNDGNWLIDSPKYLPQLIEKFHEMGGIRYIFLTHQDDVADARQYAKEFGSTRIIHEADVSAQSDAELILEGFEDTSIGDRFVVIPTPGHTAGHCVLLYNNEYLFTGDHLYWDRETKQLSCFPDYCWYSWAQQKKSVAKLADYRFSWVLTGHGQSMKLPVAEMKTQLESLIARLAAESEDGL